MNVLLSLLTLTSLCLKTAATPPARHIPCAQQNWTQPYFFVVHCLKLAPPMLCLSLFQSFQLLIDLRPLLLHMIQVLALEPEA